MNEAKQDMAVNELSDAELAGKLRDLKKWTFIRKACVPVCVVVGFACMALFASREMWIGLIASIVVALAFAALLFFTANSKTTKLKDLMGSAVTLPLLREVFEVTSYLPGGHISGQEIRSAGLIGDWDKIAGSDFIEGTYKGIQIRYSDLHLEREEEYYDEGKRKTRYITVFKGQWLICDFQKELAAALRLFERKSGTKWNSVRDMSRSSIETENIEFNKKFKILTADGHTAFYVLTPHFMEHLLAADETADAASFFCFMDGRVHIALYSGRDSFELKGVKVSDMEAVRNKFRRDLKYMTDIMDELLINDTLFKRQPNDTIFT